MERAKEFTTNWPIKKGGDAQFVEALKVNKGIE